MNLLRTVAAALGTLALVAADGYAQTNIAPRSGKGYRMDYGSSLAYTINCRPFTNKAMADNLVLKGVAIRLGEATACFDMELLRFAAVWTGGFLDISRTHLDTYKGSTEAFVDGDLLFTTKPDMGCGTNADFADPRPLAAGPVSGRRFQGLYKHDNRIVLRYSVSGTEIHELPAFSSHAFFRKLTVDPCSHDLFFKPAETGVAVSVHGQGALVQSGVVRVRAHNEPVTFVIQIGTGTLPELPEPKSLCHGGNPEWPQILSTKGRLGFGGPYVVDTLTCPEENPWNSWLRFVAMDFFSDGRAAVTTWNGDVWIVSGIDSRLQQLRWKRFAAGLFEPLGLRIVDDQVFVLERSQITRLHDLNANSEADYYESFNHDAPIGPSYHAFAFELQTDPAGNFYYARCGHRVDPNLPLNGGVIKVAKDGSRSDLIATGMRAPNGMSVGPNGEITTADNQGNWTPTSRIDFVEPGGFYGFVPHARTPEVPTDYRKPLCWIPYQVDNSSGSQVWVTSRNWGPLSGQLLHTSYGKGTLFLVLRDKNNLQGGVVQFPLRFETGIMRGRFSPQDGQLYVCGLKGWQTAGARDAALHRVRFTGGRVRMPESLRVNRDRIAIGFTCTLHESTADVENFAVEQWNYLWTEKYGSPELSTVDPKREGRDKVEIASVSLSPDKKSVYLEIPGLEPVMQMHIRYRIKGDDGAVLSDSIYNTINLIPE